MFKRVFGSKKKAPEEKAPEPPPDIGATIGKSEGRIEVLDKKIAALNAELLNYKRQLARAPRSQQTMLRQRAAQALKRKKMYEQQRGTMMATQFNMEQTQFALENIKDTADHISSMKHARDTLQDQYKKLDINSVEDLQDDLADLMADADEINEIMGRSYGVGADIDEADLDEELAGLDEELGDLDFGDMSGVQDSALPSAPSAQPVGPAAGGIHGEVDEYGLPMAQQN